MRAICAALVIWACFLVAIGLTHPHHHAPAPTSTQQGHR